METIDISEQIVKTSPKKRVTKKTDSDNVDLPKGGLRVAEDQPHHQWDINR